MLIKIIPDHISEHKIKQVVACLKDGGIIIYPTDTVYAIGCDLLHHKACERMIELKNARKKGLNFSLICPDLSSLSDYTSQISTPVYKLMKQLLPGPYTFILPSSSKIPSIFKAKKKTVGIRVPNNPIALRIAEQLGNPILTTSLLNDDHILEYETDASVIEEKFRKRVDMVIDGGPGGIQPSTVLEINHTSITMIREGAGPVDGLIIES